MRVAVLLAMIMLSAALSPVIAQERIYCPLPEHGTWVNRYAEPKQITRVEVETKCVDNRVEARIRAFTSCIPRDCKWGWTEATLRDDGSLSVNLIGFLRTKVLTVRAFGDMLDVQEVDVPHDEELPATKQVYNLERK
ncbi:serine/threonine protein kinase [Roseibium aquae]|nr:serine/threonine protein kinase [Roseibium aquae]